MSTIESDLQSAEAALRKGDSRAAREIFMRLIAGGRADVPVLLGLALACGASSDAAGAAAAVDRVLALEPRNPRALLLKADHLAASGDTRSASSYYLAAVKNAPATGIPPDLAAQLSRAREICDRHAEHYQSYLIDRLKTKGFDHARSSRRFAQSLDIVLGKKKIYRQEPRSYYFPALPQIQFYERGEFPWLDQVEQAAPDIRLELLEILKEPSAFAPYVQGDVNRPRKDQAGMLNNADWSAFYLWKNGEVVRQNAQRCPNTMQALSDVPLARVQNRSPSILFSLLKPGARIPPHNGLVNTRLICHLPIIVPGHCHFRVGNDTRSWIQDQAWVFDDTIEHEAWNDSDQTRVILLFDVWRPELTHEERSLVISLFEAIDAHGGRKPDWSI